MKTCLDNRLADRTAELGDDRLLAFFQDIKTVGTVTIKAITIIIPMVRSILFTCIPLVLCWQFCKIIFVWHR